MNPASKRFAWSDRDTAARDMLQFATYAPPFLRKRALRLLRSFRSSTIFPELEAIVFDETEEIENRHYALCAIAEMPGDLYLPQFKDFAVTDHGLFNAVMTLSYNHPSNLEWLFHDIDSLPYQMALRALDKLIMETKEGSLLNRFISERIITIVTQHPLLLNAMLLQRLRVSGHPDVIQQWFVTNSESIVYTCLLSQMNSVFSVLLGWKALREVVFLNCASLRDEYERVQRERTIDENEIHDHPRNYQLSELWMSVCMRYHAAFDDQSSLAELVRWAMQESDLPFKQAIAIYFLGKLHKQYNVHVPLLRILRVLTNPLFPEKKLNSILLFEVGYALCEVPSAEVWEALIDIFLATPHNFLERDMPYWIAYLTDRLSGSNVDTRSNWPSWRSEEGRMWHYTYEDMVLKNPFSEVNLRNPARREDIQTRA